jgi:hypothetical protein
VSITNIRTQYAVGQGFFQAGELRTGSTLRLRYVYDCGAMAKYAKARDARIDTYLGEVGAKQPLELLFISHAHADHLNGVERLLDKTSGLAVKTIVMPLLNVEDRLVAYSRAALEDAMSAQSLFYQAFVSDPISALSRFNPDRIILVEPGNRNDGAPFRDGADGADSGPPDFDPGLLGREPLNWKIVGKGTIRPFEGASKKVSGSTALLMDDTLALVVTSAGTAYSWLLAPFVDPQVKVRTATFVAALAKARGQSVPALKKWLRSSANVEKLLTVHVADLKAAYSAISNDLNVTSMCLYSGPIPDASTATGSYRGKFGIWQVAGPSKPGIAWLGTGDAALADKKRRAALFKHYRTLLHGIVTLTLPHHGSEHNFDSALLKQIQPSFCIASADRFSTWRHPGTAVIQAVSSTGRFLSVVTSDNASEVKEWASIP